MGKILNHEVKLLMAFTPTKRQTYTAIFIDHTYKDIYLYIQKYTPNTRQAPLIYEFHISIVHSSVRIPYHPSQERLIPEQQHTLYGGDYSNIIWSIGELSLCSSSRLKIRTLDMLLVHDQ